jgi:hypothetical protein
VIGPDCCLGIPLLLVSTAAYESKLGRVLRRFENIRAPPSALSQRLSNLLLTA